MKNDLFHRQSPDVFRIILVLIGILISTIIIITQLVAIKMSFWLILITLGVASIGAIISTVLAKRIAVRVGKEPLARIFISFAYSDIKFVNKLTNELSQRGFEILRADRAVLAGDNWQNKITKLLIQANFLIVIIRRFNS